jgi:hypothetical protein
MYKDIKKPLQSYSSTKSLKKTSSKTTLKRQNSSPYLHLDSGSRQNKLSISKSPKRKNKSIDMIKLRNYNAGTVATRSKFGGTFSSLKKSTGDLFTQMSDFKKDKENK